MVILLLAAGLLVKSPILKRRLLIGSLVLLLFFSNSFISSEVMRTWEVEATPYSEVGSYDLGIVLTGITESKIFPGDRVYFAKGADRVFHAYQLYQQKKIGKILMSGGTGNLYYPNEKEALKLKQVFQQWGVPEKDLIVETESRNTYENAQFSAAIIRELFVQPKCLLITSASHMSRAKACFIKAGVEVDAFSTDFQTSERKLGSIVGFGLGGFVKWTILFKEWAGLAAYKIAGYID